MKLHYSPGSCALGVHVLLEETGAPFALARIDFAARERITLIRKGEDGPVEAVTRDSFLSLEDREDLTAQILQGFGRS